MFWELSCGCHLHLTYLDDGGKGAIKILGGVIVPDESFPMLEAWASVIALDLVSYERREQFTEFHASALFVGAGVFADCPVEKRLEALRDLLRLTKSLGLSYVYSAIDAAALNRSPLRSASWIDVAFSMCARAIDEHLRATHDTAMKDFVDQVKADPAKYQVMERPSIPPRPLNLMILDEPERPKDRERIRDTFRSLRHSEVSIEQSSESGSTYRWSGARLATPVDSVFFGSSADCIGLQVADVCNWTMWKHLCGEDVSDFYDVLMSGRIVCAKPEPEWTQYRHLFRTHEVSDGV